MALSGIKVHVISVFFISSDSNTCKHDYYLNGSVKFER